MGLNVTFDIGRHTLDVKNVVVKNIPNSFYKWTATYNDKGRCIMQAEVDMEKIHTLWEEQDEPVVLDCADPQNNVYASQMP